MCTAYKLKNGLAIHIFQQIHRVKDNGVCQYHKKDGNAL